jgi:hypothetical protein
MALAELPHLIKKEDRASEMGRGVFHPVCNQADRVATRPNSNGDGSIFRAAQEN